MSINNRHRVSSHNEYNNIYNNKALLKSKPINISNNSISTYMGREQHLSEEIDILEQIALKDLKIYK